jgi:hypothetical protein
MPTNQGTHPINNITNGKKLGIVSWDKNQVRLGLLIDGEIQTFVYSANKIKSGVDVELPKSTGMHHLHLVANQGPLEIGQYVNADYKSEGWTNTAEVSHSKKVLTLDEIKAQLKGKQALNNVDIGVINVAQANQNTVTEAGSQAIISAFKANQIPALAA